MSRSRPRLGRLRQHAVRPSRSAATPERVVGRTSTNTSAASARSATIAAKRRFASEDAGVFPRATSRAKARARSCGALTSQPSRTARPASTSASVNSSGLRRRAVNRSTSSSASVTTPLLSCIAARMATATVASCWGSKSSSTSRVFRYVLSDPSSSFAAYAHTTSSPTAQPASSKAMSPLAAARSRNSTPTSPPRYSSGRPERSALSGGLAFTGQVIPAETNAFFISRCRG